MDKKRLKIFLFSFLFVFQLVYTQSSKYSDKEISKMIYDASHHLMDLENDKSLNLAHKALKEAVKLNNYELIAKSYNLIGLNYEEFSDYNKALDFYNKGLKYANKTSNDTIKVWINDNLGNVYCFQKIDFKKGIEHYKKALLLSEKVNDNIERMFIHLNLTSAYFAINDYKNGLVYLKSAVPLVIKNDLLEAKISLNTFFGKYYSHSNENDKAEKYLLIALKLGEENKSEFLQVNTLEVYDELAQFYAKTKQFDKAYLYLEKYKELKNKYYDEERINEVKTAGLHIELDEYKRQIDEIENEKELQAASIYKSKIIMTLFIVLFIIFIVMIVNIYRNNKFKEMINQRLINSNNQLKIAEEKAIKASKLKSQFVSTITHELRTPLYGVIGITNTILEEHKELNNSPHLKSLKYSAKYLLSLVNDLLQINKIEENKIVLEKLIFNLEDEMNTVKSSVENIAVKHNNELTVNIDSEIPEFLVGDSLRLSQILMNLMSNALKFTKNGKVDLNAYLVKIEGNTHFIKFEVKDNGYGIAKEDFTRIFEQFVQTRRKEDDYQGTGLGLSIVKKLVELFDSKIYLESELDVGTTFYFTIGFDSGEDKTKDIINNIEVDLTEGKKFSVLIVEDNKINQMITKKIVEKSNINCTIVDDGFAALAILEQEAFDVVLMDINMPIINGFETTKKIRERGISIPVIALTAFDKEEITEEALNSGMNDIIVKPFEPSKLHQVLNNLIYKKENVG